jgi:hypothetical protein
MQGGKIEQERRPKSGLDQGEHREEMASGIHPKNVLMDKKIN